MREKVDAMITVFGLSALLLFATGLGIPTLPAAVLVVMESISSVTNTKT